MLLGVGFDLLLNVYSDVALLLIHCIANVFLLLVSYPWLNRASTGVYMDFYGIDAIRF